MNIYICISRCDKGKTFLYRNLLLFSFFYHIILSVYLRCTSVPYLALFENIIENKARVRLPLRPFSPRKKVSLQFCLVSKIYSMPLVRKNENTVLEQTASRRLRQRRKSVMFRQHIFRNIMCEKTVFERCKDKT